jgi:hypothetical protein
MEPEIKTTAIAAGQQLWPDQAGDCQLRKLWLTIILFLTGGLAPCVTSTSAKAQTIRVFPIQVRMDDCFPKTIELFCSQNYDQRKCKMHTATLLRELRRYPVEKLGQWSFVLASTEEWRDMVRSLAGKPGSPAFTIVERRTTVFEEALFSAPADRRADLIRMFNTSGDDLLGLAVSHELGHAICAETDEHRADDYGRDLRAGKLPVCRQNRVRR